jgi:hypothetical protein
VKGNAFCGVLHHQDGVIYCAPLTPRDGGTGTAFTALPFKVRGQEVGATITHGDNKLRTASHQQLADLVIKAGGGKQLEDFVGFTIQMDLVKPFSGTSRSLNNPHFKEGTLNQLTVQAMMSPLLQRIAQHGMGQVGAGAKFAGAPGLNETTSSALESLPGAEELDEEWAGAVKGFFGSLVQKLSLKREWGAYLGR